MWDNICSSAIYDLMKYIDSPITDMEYRFVVDTSEFVVVDGEEGDYGNIKYFLGPEYGPDASQLIATRIVEGGDSEYVEYTEFGKEWIKRALIELIKDAKI